MGALRSSAMVFLLSLCVAAPADAARRWSAGEALGPAGSVGVHDAELTAQDELVALVRHDDWRIHAVMQPPGGGSQVVQELGVDGHAYRGALATGGGRTFALLGGEKGIFVTSREHGGRFAPPLRIDDAWGGWSEWPLDAAANADGEAVVTWGTSSRLASFSLPGGGWSEPQPAPEGELLLLPDGRAVFARGRGRDLVLATMRPGEPPAERVLATGATDVAVTALAADPAGRTVVAWHEDGGPEDSYGRAFHQLHLTTWRGGDDVATLDLGTGEGTGVAVNAASRGVATWGSVPYVNEHGQDSYTGMALRFDLAAGTFAPAEQAANNGDGRVAISPAGDVLIAFWFHEVFSTRARPGGRLRAVSTLGCFPPGVQAELAAIDSRGQSVVVVGGNTHPTVVRDEPAEVWGRTWCGYIPIVNYPAYHPVDGYRRSGYPVTIFMGAASDPEATAERWRWDLDDDGVFEHDTGSEPSIRRMYPAGVHAWRAEVTRSFGDAAPETLTWRFHVDVAEGPPVATVPPAPELTIGRRSLRSALRRGVPVTARAPKAGTATVELRRAGSGTLLGRRSRTVRAGRITAMQVPLRSTAKRRLRGARELRIEVRLVQKGRRLTSRRATLR